MSYEFKDKRCWRIWEAASPKGDRHLAAFAWRESPAGLERAWSKACQGKDPDEKDKLLSSCLRAAKAQGAYRQQRLAAGERLPRPRGVAVWLNAAGWAEEVEAAGSAGRTVENATCQYCDAPMVHAHYRTCSRHTPIPEGYSAWLETERRAKLRMIDSWKAKAQEEGESDRDFYKRMARSHWRKWKEASCTS